MKVVSTEALTKLIQLVKSAFVSATDTVQTSEVTLATVATSGDYADLSGTPDLSNYVTTNTTQTISGDKTFSYNVTIKKNRPLLFMADNWCTRGTNPSSYQYQAVWFNDK